MAPLGELMDLYEEKADILPGHVYQQVGIRAYGNGMFLSQEITHDKTSYKYLHKLHKDLIVVSQVKGWEGAISICRDEFSHFFVSPEYRTFRCKPDRADARYIVRILTAKSFLPTLQSATRGQGARRERLRPEMLLRSKIPAPPPDEQRRIVERLDAAERLLNDRQAALDAMEADAESMLRAAFDRIIDGAPTARMGKVAPLVRRPVAVVNDESYPELGIRSFGKGTFHKPPLPGIEVGTKKLFGISPGDLVFNIVFAWEGAIAVATDSDAGRVGSHRFLTCVPENDTATADFLRFYFLTPAGLSKIGEASPGGAGRNRTLGLKALEAIQVPTPHIDKQRWFDGLQAQVREIRALRQQAAQDAAALIPAMLHEVFNGR